MRRVKYYSKYDLSVGHYLNSVADLILGFKGTEFNNINDVLELYNCTKYIDNKLFLDRWSKTHISNLKDRSKQIIGHIAREFNRIDNANLLDVIKCIDSMYKGDFLELFSKFKMVERIDEEKLKVALELKYLRIHQICQYKNIVTSYAGLIRKELISNPTNIELLLNKYVVLQRDQTQNEIYVPNNLTMKDMHLLMDRYIECPKANVNFLELITNNKNDDRLSVTDEIRWKAKRKIEAIKEDLFSENSGISMTYRLKLDSNVKKVIDYRTDETGSTIIIDKDYLDDNLDNPSILNNFIWLFNFVDLNGRITFVSQQTNNKQFLDDLFNLASKRDYNNNTTFQILEQFGHLTMHMYYGYLNKNDIRLENIIQWFFQEYLEEEFEILEYTFSVPNQSSSYREKSRDILAEFEYLLQQYKCIVEYGEVNHEMLELSSSGIKFNDIPSLIHRKYVYPKDSLNHVFYLLFSDQSNLGYLRDDKRTKSTFYELISEEVISYDDFEEHQKRRLEYLFENGYIVENVDGSLKWNDMQEIAILKELYDIGVISFRRLSEVKQNGLLKMESNDYVYFESSLLTRQEQDLLDFYLNNSKFQNGPQIRNKYSHGRQGNKDENLNYNNYLIILRLVISIVIKINDDLCLNDKINGTEK